MVPQYLWFITPVTMIYGTHSIHRGFVTQPTIQELGRATLFFFEAKNITQHFAAMLKDRVPDMEDPREVVDFMGISRGTCSIKLACHGDVYAEKILGSLGFQGAW